MCFKGQMLKPEFRRFVFAQSVLLWLYSLNYICSLAWLAAVSRQPMTADDDVTSSDTSSSASDDTLSSQPAPDLWALWSYTAVVIVVALAIVFVLTHFRSKILVEAEEEKEEAVAQAKEDASEAALAVAEEDQPQTSGTQSIPDSALIGDQPPAKTTDGEVQPPSSPTSTSVTVPSEPASESVELKTDKAEKTNKLAKFTGYLQKIKERRKRVWDSRKVYRQRWLDKVTDMLGDSLIFMAAAGFTTAIQYSFPQSNDNYVTASWIYAFGLLFFCSFIQTAVTDKANATADAVDEEVKQTEDEAKQSERKSVAGEVMNNLLQVPLITKKKVFDQKVVKATWETLAGYLQYTQAYLIALGFTNAVLYSIKTSGDEDANVGGAWAYLIVMLMLVSGVLVLFEKKGIRKRLEGKPSYCERWRHECADLAAASIHLMACFAIPYTVALTLSSSTSANLWVLFGYAIFITIVCSIVIVWVQIILGEARERQIAQRKKRAEEALVKAMSSPPETSAKKDFRSSIKKFRANRPVISFLRSYDFQLKASKIICRGLGLTVAYAYDALLVTFVLSANSEYDNWTLWIYAIVFTFGTSIVVITVTTSKWMENAQAGGDEGDDQPQEGGDPSVGSIQTKKKSKLPGLAFQDGEEDDLLDTVEDK